MKPLVMQWEWGWQSYFISGKNNVASLSTHKLPDIIEALHYPKEITLLMEEDQCLFGSLKLDLTQSSPFTIHQWKLLVEELKLSMEHRYHIAIESYSIECLQLTVNGEEQQYILWQQGHIQGYLNLFALHSKARQELQYLEQEGIMFDIYPRSFFFLRHQQSSGQYVILHKHTTQVIHREDESYQHLYELNTGRQDFYNLLHQHGLSLKALEATELTEMQRTVLQECIEMFLRPIAKRLQSLGGNYLHRYFLSDVLQYPFLLEQFHTIIQQYSQAFLIPMTQQYKKVFHSPVVEKYISPLLFDKNDK
jgi:hypothetical protein